MNEQLINDIVRHVDQRQVKVMCDAEGLLDDPMEVAEMMKRVFLLQASRFAVVIAAGEGGEATPTQTVVGYLVAQRKAVDTVAISLLEKL